MDISGEVEQRKYAEENISLSFDRKREGLEEDQGEQQI